jgi:PAS domain S-box-containing protein
MESQKLARDQAFREAVRTVTQVMHAHDGDNLLRLLAKHLCQLCGASYGVVAKFGAPSANIASTLVFVRQGAMLENVEYDVRDTPCEQVHHGAFCSHDGGVQQKFPKDAMLGELGVDAYMGIPLVANDGRILGLIALLHESRFANSDLAESLLRIVASRVAAELERRDIEQTLQTEQVRFNSVFENASDAIFLHDEAGVVVDANRQACLNLGYERNELIGVTPMAFDPDITPENLAMLLERQKLGETATFETRHRRKDGEIFPVEIRLRSYWRDGTRFGIAIVIDLRERRASAAALQAAQQRLALVLDASKVGFWEWDAATSRISFSSQWRQQLGYPETECPATSEVWRSRIHPEDFPVILEAISVLKLQELETQQVDVRIRHAEGGWRWIHLRGQAFRDSAGALQRFVGIHIDDTKRKRAEHTLNHQKAVLERIAKGESLSWVLEAIVDFVESQFDEARASILLLKGDQLWYGAGDRLPPTYVRAIEGVKIGPNVGSCGAAAYRAQTVVVADIASDPLWKDYKDLALSHGLRSCWSMPIFSGKVAGAQQPYGQVLGAFAIYGSAPSRPSAEDFEIINNATYLAGIAIERAKTEAALRDSESRLAGVIANSPGVAIQWYDGQGRVMKWNRASEEMFGFSEEEAMHRKLDELIHTPEQFAEFLAACDQIRSTGEAIGPVEFEFLRRNGDKGVCLSTLFQIPGDEGGELFVCMDVDISTRKRSEEAVQRSSEMLRVILDNIPQGVVWKDRNSRYVGFNAVVGRAMGFDQCNPIGRSDFEIPCFTREQSEFFVHKDREVMEADSPQFQIVEPMSIADGRTIWLNTSKIPLHDADGRVNGVLVTWEDFTEKRRSQELLQLNMALLAKAQSLAKLAGWVYDFSTGKLENSVDGFQPSNSNGIQSTLEELIALAHPEDLALTREAWEKSLAGELVEYEHRIIVDGEVKWLAVRSEPERNEAGELVRIVGVSQDITDRKRLEEHLLQAQKYEGIGVLAGGIAHEFNNILTSVLGNVELGVMSLPPDSKAAPIFAEIGKSARRAAALTKQMLAYSGRGQILLAPLHWEAIVQDAAPVLQSMATNRAELEFKLEPAPAIGDVVQLRQIAMQLVNNALESLTTSAGRITIRTGASEFTEDDLADEFALPPRSAGRYSFLEVADTGCGMTSEVASKIFDPFFTTKFAGRGLGLAAVLGIVKRHHGAVQVKTSPGDGTTIRVFIPQQPTMVEHVAPFEKPPLSRAQKGLLLVEDEPTVREFLLQLLSGAGYKVFAARDGVEAIALANRHTAEIEVILLDIVMPQLDGRSVIGPLRQILPTAPIILMSGYDEPTTGDRNRTLDHVTAFLHKPFRPHQLFTALKQAHDKFTTPSPPP